MSRAGSSAAARCTAARSSGSAKEADIPGRSIGLINIFDKFSFVEVPEQFAERVLAVMHKNSIRGYKVNIEPAHSKD